MDMLLYHPFIVCLPHGCLCWPFHGNMGTLQGCVLVPVPTWICCCILFVLMHAGIKRKDCKGLAWANIFFGLEPRLLTSID